MALRKLTTGGGGGYYAPPRITTYGIQESHNSHQVQRYELDYPRSISDGMTSMTKAGWEVLHIHVDTNQSPKAMWVLWQWHDMQETPSTRITTERDTK